MEHERCPMESMALTSQAFWKGKKVFVTGHTGFKGSWLVTCLTHMGADVCGYSLAPEEGSLWSMLELPEVKSVYGDIRDEVKLKEALLSHSPDIILHLAAQAIVETGYREPSLTFSTNIMGTYNVLACSLKTSARVILNVTTDKVYENTNLKSHKESDPLGGLDPYSASKACSEIITQSMQASFAGGNGKTFLSARAGNVIGGGDWGSRRIIPDILKAVEKNQELEIRQPDSIRPWQHVLDAISGYLLYVETAWSNPLATPKALNFSPGSGEILNVKNIIEIVEKNFPGFQLRTKFIPAPFKEDEILLLDSSLATQSLGWRCRWTSREAVARTFIWHERSRSGVNPRELILSQFNEFTLAV